MVDCLPQCRGTHGGLSALVQWMEDCLFLNAVALMVDFLVPSALELMVDCLLQCNGTDGGLSVFKCSGTDGGLSVSNCSGTDGGLSVSVHWNS